ncbi:hypothetical protein KAX02_09965 [candidate division WOR-3 bacterium]|nr:hypothetical protein [candidate division WOR-3 bacterium]
MSSNKRVFGVLMAVLTVCFVTSCIKDKEKIQLRLCLQAGESYNLRMVVEQKISQTIQEQTQDILQTIGTGYTFDVEDVDFNGSITVKVTYHSILFKQDGPMGKFEYDSSNPPVAIPPMAMGFNALVGQSFTMIISPEGNVKDIYGVDEMLSNMIEQLDLPDFPMMDDLMKNLKGQFGDEALKENMEKMMAVFPDSPVGIGDRWTKRLVLSRGFPVILDNTWTLKARKDGLAIIEVRSVVEPNEEAPPIDMGIMKINYKLSGEQKGTMEIQEVTGWPVQGELTQKFSGQVEMEGATQLGASMSWPISIESVIRFEPF